MNKQEINLALTQAACRVAEKKGVPLSRRVRYTSNIDNHAEVRRDHDAIFLSASLPSGKAADLLEDAVLQAARVDHDWRSKEDLLRQKSQAEDTVRLLAYRAGEAAVKGHFEETELHLTRFRSAVERLKEMRGES